MLLQQLFRKTLIAGLVGLSSFTTAYAAISQVPLYLTTAVKPNVMLMLDDSGSMWNIVPDTPYDPNATYLANCPSSRTLSGGVAPPAMPPSSTSYWLQVSSGIAMIDHRNAFGITVNLYTFGTGSGKKCFDPAKRYNAKLETNAPVDAVYTGHYLNWYFGNSPTYTTAANFGSGATRKPGTQSRLEIAKTAAKNLVDSLGNIRLGLSTYDNDLDGVGSDLLEIIGDLDATKKTDVKSKINALDYDLYTPLAETLADIGRYFTTGYSGTLTLHPGKSNQSTASVATVFNNHSIKNSSGVSSPLPSPIQYSCQKSYAVLMTDGLPTKDRNINSVLQDYDGDCSGSNASNCIASPHYDMKIDGVYEVALLEPSDYLDDVAQALYEMDLRPDLIKKAGQKNNVASYIIGFADEQVLNNPLLQDAASQGGGLFIAAKDSSEIATALQSAFTDIIAKNSSAASVATNSTRLDTGTLIYQAKFNSGDWSGHLLAYQINPDGSVGALKWDAADHIPAPSTRNIFSYNPTATGTKGISFLWNNLNSTQQDALHTLNGTNDSKGQDRLDYLRGDQSKEQASGPFRKRSVLLGDIINSDPWFVGTENFGYHRLPSPEGPAYTTFRNGSSYTGRRKMVYIGANDGMLHGFDAANDTTNGGKEIFAYTPNAIISKLSKLTDPTYGATTNPHQYFVDGAPKAGDAYINGAWKTLLAGTLGAGGKGVFVLDVTNPDGFDATDVLWEVTDTTGPEYADLGYTLPQPSIVRLANGDWGVIVANGYDSASKKAVLYILDAENGSIIKKFDTLVGNVSNPNGLSTPIAVDKDNNRIVDVIFAGDLQGNLWEFDVSDPAGASAWDFAYGGAGPEPFFVACSDQSNCANTRQPITAKPQVGKGPDGQGVMVYFGTGKYFETGDNIVGPSPQVQTYYALWENGAQVSGRSVLQEQTILAEGTVGSTPVRVTSDNDVDYNNNQKGWYMDLTPPPPSSPAGERVVSPSLLRGGRIIFVSIIPESDPCSFGGTSWLYELDALSGSRLSTAQFDMNGDGKIDKADLVQILDTNNDGVVDTNDDVPPSGKELPIGISKNPSVIPAGDYDYKHSSGTTGGIAVTKEKGAEESGRLSWRQLQY